MSRIIFNDYLDAAMALIAVAVVLTVLAYGVIRIRQARATPQRTAIEVGGVAVGHG